MLSLGWFSTGNGDGSLGLFNEVHKAIELGILDARIDFVFCNREKGESQGSDRFLDRVSSVGIPTVSLSSSRFRSEHGGGSFDKHRLAYDGEIIKALSQFNVDLCILAGYMLILGKELCQSYRMLNLHPALPGGPTGTWRDVIWKLVEERSKINGAYVHLVTEELDKGPIITYCSFPIADGEYNKLWVDIEGVTVDSLKEEFGEQLPVFSHIRNEGMKRERPLILETLKVFANGTIKPEDLEIDRDQIGTSLPICLDIPIKEFLNEIRP